MILLPNQITHGVMLRCPEPQDPSGFSKGSEMMIKRSPLLFMFISIFFSSWCLWLVVGLTWFHRLTETQSTAWDPSQKRRHLNGPSLETLGVLDTTSIIPFRPWTDLVCPIPFRTSSHGKSIPSSYAMHHCLMDSTHGTTLERLFVVRIILDHNGESSCAMRLLDCTHCFLHRIGLDTSPTENITAEGEAYVNKSYSRAMSGIWAQYGSPTKKVVQCQECDIEVESFYGDRDIRRYCSNPSLQNAVVVEEERVLSVDLSASWIA